MLKSIADGLVWSAWCDP